MLIQGRKGISTVVCISAAIWLTAMGATMVAGRAETPKQKGGEEVWQKLKERSQATPSDRRKIIGGPCSYATHSGICTIESVRKTAASIHQNTVGGGPGYEGFEVLFTYRGEDLPEGKLIRQALEGKHELRLSSDWHPGPRFLEKYAIAAGRTFPCTLKVIEKGSCSPTLFEFQSIDRTDYFETRR